MSPGVIALATLAAILLGAGCWAGLAWWDRRRPLTARALWITVLLLGALGRLVYVFATPVFYAPDEQSHFNYVKHLVEVRSLPVLATGLGDPANEWEHHQPPLYYLLLAPVYAAAHSFTDNPAGVVFSLRLVSVVLWLITLRLGWIFLEQLNLGREFRWLCVLTLGCLLPTYVFISATINNDNLLTLVGTATLCLLTTPRRTRATIVALGVMLGVGLWVKASALVLFPAVGVLFVVEAWQRRLSPRTALLQAVVVFGLATLLYAPWAIRNWWLYATFTPESLAVATKQWPSIVDGLLSAAHNLTKTFWSVAGISNDVGYPFPLLGMSFGLLGVAGLVLGWRQHPQPLRRWLATDRAPLLVALGVAVLINVLLVLRLGYLYGMGQGRHLFPLLLPIALFLAHGLKSIPAHRPEIPLIGFWITYALAFETFSLCCFPR